MIKNKRTSYGLDKRFAQINEFEESGVFEIRMPLDFKLGKNEVKLKLLPNKLLKGSEVLIDIFDKNGNSIYYEISNIANEDESRSLIVFIYEDTVPGKCKIYLNAVLVNNKTYQCQITSDVITTVENTQEIKFSEEPKVKYTERTLQTQVFSTSTRQTSKNGTGDISIVSTISPKQTERDNLSIEKKEVRTVDQITSIANNIGSGSTFEIPTFFSPSTIISRNFPFSSSMEGGTIFVNGISLEVPSNALSSSPFLNQSFSASILKVIGTGAIEVYPPFRKTIEYQTSNGATLITFDRFFNHSNFTASYKELLTLQNSGYSQSYAVFDLSNIQPDSGVVDAVEVSYKSLNLIGSNYQPVGTFEVKSQNLLIDSASVFFKNPDGIVETPIGNFRSGLADFNTYWSTSSMGLTFPTASVSSKIVDGIKIDYGYRYSTGSFVTIEPKPQYKINIAGANTQLNLSFDSFSESDLTDYIPQLDVYISGSEIITEPNQESIQLIPLASSSFGTYIGSISQTFGKVRKNSFTFVSKKSGNIVPKLISRVGKWHIGNIELKSIDEKGFNCNQTRIYAPMNLPTGSEVNFKIDYLNPSGRKTQTFSSIIEGVIFQGSTIRSGATIPPGTVSGSDQLTGSFDNRYETRGRSIVSGSEQLTSSYDGRYERKGTNIVSSSAQVISGSDRQIIVFSGSNAVSGSDNLVWSGSKMGIGLSTPSSSLDVFGKTANQGINANVGYNITTVVAPPNTFTLTAVSGSGLNSGTYYYHLSYYNAFGDTETNTYQSITLASGTQQVQITNIPTSSNLSVIGRKIYRNKVNEGSSYGEVIATIADNTTTSYLDSIPDSSLSATQASRLTYAKANLTSKFISINGVRALIADGNLTTFGYNAGNAITNAVGTTLFGSNAGRLITYGAGNTIFGHQAGLSITTGNENHAFGQAVLTSVNIGSYNIGIGSNVLYNITSGQHNIALGYYTLNSLGAAGSNNIFIGGYTTQTTGNNNIALGHQLTMPSTSGSNQMNIGGVIFGQNMYNVITGKIGIGKMYPNYQLDVSQSVNFDNNLTVSGSVRISGSAINSPANGIITLSDSSSLSFNRINFGGNTSAEPAIQKAGAAIYFRLADDSGYTNIRTSGIRLYSGASIVGLLESAQIRVFSTTQYQWSNNSSDVNSTDTGIARHAAGVVRITNGSGGTGSLIADQVTGSFSGSFAGQYSSSQQVDYNQITNKPVVSGSRLYGILISSGSASSSYSHQNLTYDTSQSKFQVTGSTNLNGNLFMTGSTSTRFSYTWDGPKTVGLTPGIVWTNMENATNIWLGTGPSLGQDAMYIGDFTEITQGRLFTAMGVAAAGPTSSLEVQYSLNGLTSWTPMITLAIGNTTGIKDSNWIRIPAGAQQFTYIRLVGYGGNGVADPRFSPPIALFR